MEAKSFLATQECTKGGRIINVTSHSRSWEQRCPQHSSLQNSLAPVVSKLDVPIFQLVTSHLRMFTLFFLSYRGISQAFSIIYVQGSSLTSLAGEAAVHKAVQQATSTDSLAVFPSHFLLSFKFCFSCKKWGRSGNLGQVTKPMP